MIEENGINLFESRTFRIPVSEIKRMKEHVLDITDREEIKKRFDDLSGDMLFSSLATGNDDKTYCGVFPVEVESVDGEQKLRVKIEQSPLIFAFTPDNTGLYAKFISYAKTMDTPLVGAFSFHYNTFSDREQIWKSVLPKMPVDMGFEILQTNVLKSSHVGNTLSNFAIQNGIEPNIGDIDKKDTVENVIERLLLISLMSNDTLQDAIKGLVSPVRFSLEVDIGKTFNADGMNELSRNFHNMSRFTKMRNLGWQHYVDTNYYQLPGHASDLKTVFEQASKKTNPEQHLSPVNLFLNVTKNLNDGINNIPGIAPVRTFDMRSLPNFLSDVFPQEKMSITQNGKIKFSLGSTIGEVAESLEDFEKVSEKLSSVPVTMQSKNGESFKVEDHNDLLRKFIEKNGILEEKRTRFLMQEPGMI